MDPILRFQEWLAQAEASEPDVPTAMALATVDDAGFPAVRVVLLRGVDERGFTFFTNYTSHKASQLEAFPHAALCFHWKSLLRQVRVRGTVTRVSAAESDAYFSSRPQPSQVAALASHQSAALEQREDLERRFTELTRDYDGRPVARPSFWGGYRVAPTSIEFWRQGDHRLHHRELYERTNDGWRSSLLNP